MENRQNTLFLIKPDAVAAGHADAIMQMIKDAGLDTSSPWVQATLPLEAVETHYAEHRDRPFYGDLCAFMTSGPIWAVVVCGEDAVARLRTLVGATDPAKAAPGTIRARFGTAVNRNAVHASDSPESAEREVATFFRRDGEMI